MQATPVRLLPILASALLLAGCLDVNPETMRSMSSQGLCDFTNPAMFTTSAAEREAANRELARRGLQCQRLADGRFMAVRRT